MKRREWRWPRRGWEQRKWKKPEEGGVGRGVGGVMQMCMVRAGRELLRGLTVSSWEVNPSLHTLPMLPPQAKRPLGQGPLEISESWKICVCVCGGGGGFPWEGASQVIRRFSKASLGKKKGSLGSLEFPGLAPSALPRPEPPAQSFRCLLILVIF